MNISKLEQRVLHVLSQGGRIAFVRNVHGKVIDVTCFSREGFVLTDCKIGVFRRLKRRGFVKSQGGKAIGLHEKGESLYVHNLTIDNATVCGWAAGKVV